MCLAVVVLGFGFGFGLRKGGKGRGRVRVESNGGFSWLESGPVELKIGLFVHGLIKLYEFF